MNAIKAYLIEFVWICLKKESLEFFLSIKPNKMNSQIIIIYQ